ncbi:MULTISPECIES: hypothetical protein [Novosphingobium]|uniref:DUF2635 domain-containing protein n=1 Tax=Novosphingobium clariflavum TaxID=2029884 RepID=A0ABV6S4P6_9SPHN|nr:MULTISPECIES: hypothetical protein [Novosphingobium]QSR16068.1 hypothetical protein CA833_02455 [Novosphingobium sp. KA1]
MRVVSVPGRRIVDPVTRRVVDERGIVVNPHDPHWTRLIDDGDVAIGADEPVSTADAEGEKE